VAAKPLATVAVLVANPAGAKATADTTTTMYARADRYLS
jgi:hypothetical protein